MANNCSIRDAQFVVVDFETVTPKGRPPEPLELAAVIVGPNLEVQKRCFETLIKPPFDAPLTAFDTAQTGIRHMDIESAPSASEAIASFNAWCRGKELLFVAQNASYEARIFSRFREVCPCVRSECFLDTVLLGKAVLPDLSGYRLDSLATRLGEAIPGNRHRAMPDVDLTARVFIRLILDGMARLNWAVVMDLLAVAGVKDRADNSPSGMQENQLPLF